MVEGGPYSQQDVRDRDEADQSHRDNRTGLATADHDRPLHLGLRKLELQIRTPGY